MNKKREKGEKMRTKDTKGITLIALIITIIILLILAGISMVSLTGNNGILNKANMSKIENRGATVEERKNLWKANQTTDTIVGGTSAGNLVSLLEDLEKEELITKEEKKLIEDYGEVTIGSRTIIFGVVGAKGEIITAIEKNKNQDGTINYENLKNDLSIIENIQGVPSDLNENSFPLVLKVKEEYFQMESNGQIGNVKTFSIFPFLSNANIALQDFGISSRWLNSERKSFANWNFGAGGWSYAWGYWSGWFEFDLNILFKVLKPNKISVDFRLQGDGDGTSTGHINVYGKDGSLAIHNTPTVKNTGVGNFVLRRLEIPIDADSLSSIVLQIDGNDGVGGCQAYISDVVFSMVE
ncbi:MAG: hypothetical protein HFJ33_01705 [Clostridia bacterium]|nr:hypothetical protein [Clostridia bacterium]